jgi:hypothetical protein
MTSNPIFEHRICGKTDFITSIGPKNWFQELFFISSDGISSIGPVVAFSVVNYIYPTRF